MKGISKGVLFSILTILADSIITGTFYEIFGVQRGDNNFYRYISLLLSIIIISILFYFINKGLLKETFLLLKLKKNTLYSFFKIQLLLICFFCISVFISIHIGWLEKIDSEINGLLLIKFFLLSLCVALTEELVFRGFILGYLLKRTGIFFSLFFTSLVFSFSQFSYDNLAP